MHFLLEINQNQLKNKVIKIIIMTNFKKNVA